MLAELVEGVGVGSGVFVLLGVSATRALSLEAGAADLVVGGSAA